MKEGKYFWRGINYHIPICCVMFFENEWDSIRKENSEYGSLMRKLTNNQGIIFCPNCLIKKLKIVKK